MVLFLYNIHKYVIKDKHRKRNVVALSIVRENKIVHNNIEAELEP